MVVRNTDSQKGTELYNYGQVIFIKHYITGEQLSELLELAYKQARFLLEVPDFGEVIIDCKLK
ncbi:hypothetical protein D3C74_485470 [compost metagenome]